MMAEQECHEEVSRRGEVQPCNKVAVAMRFDPTFGDPYPVCAFHARGSNMMSLSAVEAAVRADMQQGVEWEYGVVGPTGHTINNGDYTREQTHRRVKAGPWLPVTPSTPNQTGAEQ